jgi:hypothetical protein
MCKSRVLSVVNMVLSNLIHNKARRMKMGPVIGVELPDSALVTMLELLVASLP